jgi:hypothetical protein
MNDPDVTSMRCAVIMRDQTEQATVAELLGALRYECSTFFTLDDFDRDVKEQSELKLLIVDIVEPEELTRLFTILAKIKLLTPVVVIASDIRPLLKFKEFKLIYQAAPYPLAGKEQMEVILSLVHYRFECEQRSATETTVLKERAETAETIQHAVSILTRYHQVADGYAKLQKVASSHESTIPVHARVIVKAAEKMEVRKGSKRNNNHKTPRKK